ncbi:MAG: restriction endonuclease [Chloroflexota bacterium]|nr:restriction endonuclease [Chloroflexota bacterium]
MTRPRVAMRQIDLQEYVTSAPLRLSADELDVLGERSLSLTITPARGKAGAYCLTPGATIGALEIGDLSVVIRPKLDISRVLFLASYAPGAFDLREERFDFKEEHTLVEALALALEAAARRAFARGLLHGYRTEEAALHTVRGRILVAEQIRRRFGVPVPIEVRYDEFTEDILANRLVKAAAGLLGRMHIRSARARNGLRWISAMLGNVTPVQFAPSDVPLVTFDRLNAHYREVVLMARLILRHWAFEADRGGTRAAGFLMNMNTVFQEFVTEALREELRVGEHTLCSDKELSGQRRIYLDDGDDGGQIRLKPDLTWWDGATCTFVGDAKYKNVTGERVPNADLYQLLAYTTALDVPGGLLVYARGEAAERAYRVRNAGKLLEVVAVDLGGSIDELQASIGRLAARVRALRAEARRQALAA